MNTKKVQTTIDRLCIDFFTQYPQLKRILQILCENSAIVFLVGGAVRDAFLGRQAKDFDLEVHKLSLEDLQAVLSQFGPVDEVGKSFGVLRLKNLSVEWSVARKDFSGRKPVVTLDPSLRPRQAFARRDLTVNAMGVNLCTNQLYDPFNGLNDLEKGVLTPPDRSFFEQDPLRFYRVMQFISRFDMHPDYVLEDICMHMSIADVSKERIEMEFEKLFLRSERPSLGIRWLARIGRLPEVLPYLAKTIGVKQRPDYHPEGDVFEHSMQTLDAAARLVFDDKKEKVAFCWAALLHDIGKPETTVLIDGALRCPEHAEVGAQLAQRMLRGLIGSRALRKKICTLIHYHMRPIDLTKNNAGLGAYKRLAYSLWPNVTMRKLALLRLCDQQGRNPSSSIPLEREFSDVEQFIEQAHKAGVLEKPEDPVVAGRDLTEFISEGPLLGKVLERVYQVQMDQGIKKKETLLARARDIYLGLCQP